MKEFNRRCHLATIHFSRLILGLFVAAVLFPIAGRAGAQGAPAGPLPAATPSDQPSPPSRAATTQAGTQPKIAGTWKLNKDQSDDPRQKMRQAMGDSGGGRGTWGGMGGGQRGGGMGRGRDEGREGGGMMNDFSELTIEQTASSTKVTGSSGSVLALYSSANSTGGNASDSGDAGAPPAAQWQDNRLVVVTQGRRGGSTTRTYELSPDSKQLYVTTKMQNPRFQQPVTIRFVYDAVPSSK